MPGPMLTATRGNEKRTFAGDDAELLRAAVEKGWSIDGHTVVQRENSYRAVPADRADLLEAATSKGWALLGGNPAEAGDVLPDVPLAEQQPAVTNFGEAALAASAPMLQQRADAAAQQRFLRDLEAQRAEEARRAQLEQEHGAGLSARGLGNAAATMGEGVSRGLSLGFDAPAAYIQAGVDQALEGIAGPANPDVPRTFGDSVEAAKKGIAGRSETNPMLAAGSELTGAVLPALATGGETLAARVLAKTPAGFVARKAVQYGAGAGAKVALTAPGLKGAALRVVAPAVKLGVEGGVQGAAQGAGAEVNRLWMDEDPHGVAEYLSAAWEGGTQGAKLGSALGAGLGLAVGGKALAGGVESYEKMARGQGLLRLPAEGAEAAAPAMTAYPEPAEPGFVKRQAAKVAGLKPEQAAKMRDEAYPGLMKKWNEFIGLREQLEELNIAAKREWAKRVAPEPARFSFSSVIDDEGLGLSKASLDDLANDGAILHDGKGGAAAVKRLSKQLEALDAKLLEDDLTDGVTHGEVVSAVDQAKRSVDQVVAWAETRNKYLYETLAPRAQQLREFLENEEAVGAALAKGQRDTNGTWAPAIRAKMDSALDSMEATGGVQKAGSYKSAGRINDSWLSQRMSNAGSNVEAQSEDAVNRLLNTATDDALMRSGTYGSKASQEAAKRVAQLRDEIQAEMGGIAKLNKSVAAPTGDNLTVLGTEIPLSGYAVEAARNRITRAAHKATMDTGKRVDKAAALPALLGKKPSAAAVAITKTAQQREKIAAGVERFYDQVANGESDAENARYVAMLEQTFGPDMANAERARFSRQQQFLMEKAGDPKSPLFRTQFLKYAEPALHPLEAIDRIASGSATAEDRETLKALHPQLFASFMRRALEQVAKASPTYDQRLRISQALGVPLDASLEPARYQMHQEIAAQQAGMAGAKRQQNQVLTPGNRQTPDVTEIVEP